MKIKIFALTGLIIGSFFLAGCQSNTPAPSTTDSEETQAIPVEEAATAVTVTTVSQDNTYYLEALGTVEAEENVRIFPQAVGQIADFKVKEGDVVTKGDTLFRITGANGGPNPLETQLQLALTSYQNAQRSLEIAMAGGNAAERMAALQLQSARNQTAGAYTDLEAFNENIATAEEGLDLLRDSYETTLDKNDRDLKKARQGIEELAMALEELEYQKNTAVASLQQQINSTTDVNEQARLQQELQQTLLQFEEQRQKLESQLLQAETGYEALQNGTTLGENQLLAQIAQAEGQTEALALTQRSMAAKLGLYGGSSDPERLASEGLQAAKIQQAALIQQIRGQVDAARFNVELLQNQAAGLTVKAPVSGVVGEILVQNGDQVAPQVALTSIISKDKFELKVPVDIESADAITLGAEAEVMIGKKYMKVPIKSIAPTADQNSKLVNITVALPKIFFRANQSLKVKIPLDNLSKGGEVLYLPLDAVIIGTEEQYVFVEENGQAKKVNVTLGTINGDLVEISEGLKAGDNVILSGAKDLVEGKPVTIN